MTNKRRHTRNKAMQRSILCSLSSESFSVLILATSRSRYSMQVLMYPSRIFPNLGFRLSAETYSKEGNKSAKWKRRGGEGILTFWCRSLSKVIAILLTSLSCVSSAMAHNFSTPVRSAETTYNSSLLLSTRFNLSLRSLMAKKYRWNTLYPARFNPRQSIPAILLTKRCCMTGSSKVC